MATTELRRFVLPVEHLEAELLAAPFSSQVAFEQSLLALDAGMSSGTAALWREQERELTRRFPGMSIDELVMRRDRTWFREPTVPSTATRDLLGFLRAAATELIGPTVSLSPIRDGLRPVRESAEQWRRRWRWTTFALPADLILASLGRSDAGECFLSKTLHLMLQDHGFAESHLHLKAAIEFPSLWSSLQTAIASSEASAEMLGSPGAEFNEGRGLAPWVVRCALSRFALGGFLASPRWRRDGFRSYLVKEVLPRMTTAVGPLGTRAFSRALSETAFGNQEPDSPQFSTLRHLLASFASRSGSEQIGASRIIAQLDPLHRWYSAASGSQPESGYLSAVFEYLDSFDGSRDMTFCRLFWQTQRIRVFFYRHVVQRPMTPGLLWFARTYSRLSAPRRPIQVGSFVVNAARLAGPGLRSLELRMVPEDCLSSLFQLVTDIDQAARQLEGTEVGIVFHFSRTRGSDAERGRPKPWGKSSHEDPGARTHNPSQYRYAGYYLTHRAEAVALANLLLTYPRMLERVRGLDLCTDELGVPLWVMLPLIEHVRRAGALAVTSLQSHRHSVSPLRLTIHAGEDFVHLLGSIRRVGEAMEYIPLREGDRIGHGVSLGVDVKEWATRTTGLAIPRGERLLELLWAWRTAACSKREDLRSWLSWMEREACRLESAIFGSHYGMNALEEWQHSLHSIHELAHMGFPNGSPHGSLNTDSRTLLDAWLRNVRVFEKAQVLEPIDVAAEVTLLEGLQTQVREWLARTGVIVEINPSSNLLIGHLGDLTNHPLWRLCPPRSDTSDSAAIRVCIGSDDPVTFATHLPAEYQLLLDAMVEGGLSVLEANRWLDQARSTGMAARFTVPRSSVPLRLPTRFRRLPVTL